jgi:hypothetical protein
VNISDLKIIVFGDNHNWGKGDTLEQALKLAGKPRNYIAYVAHPDTVVDGMGGMSYPEGQAPKNIIRKGVKVKAA